MTIDQMIQRMNATCQSFQAWGFSARFDLPEGTIFLHPCGHISSVYDNADCSFRTNWQVLTNIIDKKLDPMSSVITGKIHVAGNISAALKLKSIIE
ncbi:MAG: SCP2 sterol-binding domain-containing protein [Spirosomataceae bacterium]